MNHPRTSAAAPPQAAAASPLPFSTHWTLLLLLFVYTMSFTDRQIIGILMQPIKTEFGASDTAMGLLSGLAFAPVSYTHLDVYKRQPSSLTATSRASTACCRRWPAVACRCRACWAWRPTRQRWARPSS